MSADVSGAFQDAVEITKGLLKLSPLVVGAWFAAREMNRLFHPEDFRQVKERAERERALETIYSSKDGPKP